jgi:hypothetical protein
VFITFQVCCNHELWKAGNFEDLTYTLHIDYNIIRFIYTLTVTTYAMIACVEFNLM